MAIFSVISVWWIIGGILLVVLATGFKTVRPLERGLIERLGDYQRFANPGLQYVIPFVERIFYIDITENMVDADPQVIITKDKLNAKVDAQIYFKVRSDEPSVMASQYNVYNYEEQIVQLARTTLRNIIGTMSLNEVNSERDTINLELKKILTIEAKPWGIEIVRAELKEVDPPGDVQAAMNQVVIAESEKVAAVDRATAAETVADGMQRAAIKEAQGMKRAKVLTAEGEAEAIKLVNQAANKWFRGNAQKLKQMEVTQASLQDNSKIVLTERGINPVVVFGDKSIIPIKK